MTTPGPWERNGNAVHKRVSKHYASCVAVCEGVDRHDNARLIAAAPELLTACKMLLRLSLPSDISGQRMVEEARRAVEKATGENA